MAKTQEEEKLARQKAEREEAARLRAQAEEEAKRDLTIGKSRGLNIIQHLFHIAVPRILKIG